MGVIFKLAINNLRQQKSKSIIIGLFIAVGIVIVELGNGFLVSVEKGMEKDFRANYTGDIMISAPVPKGVYMDIVGLTDMSNVMESKNIIPLVDVEKVDEVLTGIEGISKKTKVVSTQVLLMKSDYAEFQLEDQDTSKRPVAYIFAGQNPEYFDMFPSQKILEGHRPTAGTNEILVENVVRDLYEEFFKEPLEVGKTIILTGVMGDIMREATVCGFYEQPNKNSAMFALVYADPSLARSFAGLTYGASFTQELPENIDTTLGAFSEEDLFGSDDFDFFAEDSQTFVSSDKTDFDSILGDTSLRDELNKTDDGAWDYILLKCDKPKKTPDIIFELNRQFTEKNINAVARDWAAAADSFVSTSKSISSIFTALVIILAIVVFIIIMNTMVISVIERTGEIGTMRAIGASKNFVRKLFFCESVTLTLIAEIAGSVVALIIMLILNLCHISVDGIAAKAILSGGGISFIPTIGNFLGTMLVILVGTILANLYPVSSALKITPLKALSKSDS